MCQLEQQDNFTWHTITNDILICTVLKLVYDCIYYITTICVLYEGKLAIITLSCKVEIDNISACICNG